MPQTMSQKILAKASGKKSVESGELVWANVDILMTHDPCSPGVISIFKNEFGQNAKVWDKKKHIMIPDHFIFTADEKSNRNVRIMREFAREQSIEYFYDVGTNDYKGVCHIALAEGGHNRPGEVLLGTDSHTVTSGAFGTFAVGVGNTDAAFVLGTGKSPLKVPETIKVNLRGSIHKRVMAKDIILKILGDITVQGATYKTLEFAGEAIDNMGVEDRMTICNMVIECGAKNGIIEPNSEVLSYIKERTTVPFDIISADNNAKYHSELNYELSDLKPLIAKPHSPDNVDTVESIEGKRIDRAYIGSCTGGKISDFVAAAEIIAGKKVTVETFVVPATKEVTEGLITTKMNNKTLFEIFRDAGVSITMEPSCAACLGGPIDTFGRVNKEMNVISTTNRNFRGRMGDKKANIYLASPYTVAASAITGVIYDPSKI